MAKPILVTGGAGFIGLHLVRRLIEEGAEVVVLDNFQRGQSDADFDEIVDSCTVIEADLTDPACFASLGEYGDVYHLAGLVGTALVRSQPAQVLHANALSTLHLLEYAASGQAERVWFASTSEVYAAAVERELAPVPTGEAVPVVFEADYQPRTAYAVSKHLGEQMAQAFRFEGGLPVVACRFHNVYGPRMGNDHVIPQFIGRILDKADPFMIYGNQSRAYCYIDDALDLLLGLRGLPEPPVVVNIGNGDEEVSAVELAHRLFEVADWSAPLEIHPAAPASPERRCPDVGLASRLTGINPSWTLNKGLESTFSWYRHKANRS